MLMKLFSPNSGEYDVSASEDSPMAVVEASSSASNNEEGRLIPTASDILSDVEEYTLDIVAHTKKVEVKFFPFKIPQLVQQECISHFRGHSK